MLPKYAPGEKIPGTPYVVAHRIGRGGMGDVLAVRDEHLDVLRAIKLLDLEPRPGQKRADAVTEVLKEAVIIAKLHKLCREHIVEVLFVGQTADANQIPYIVMELIDGAPLRDLLKRRGGKLEPAHARQVGLDVLAALAAAHDLGIVHRDLKPANIMCEMLDQNRVRMKVIDFGITGGVNQRTKRIAGTFRYAAPEQIHILGPSPLMAQTDLYSLGCILYECIAGQGPFDAYCRTNEHFVHAHLTAEAPPISALVPGIRPEFDAFFSSILAKDPGRRPPSARACAAQLMDLPWDFSDDNDVTKTAEMLEAAIHSVVRKHEESRGGAPLPSHSPIARSPGHNQIGAPSQASPQNSARGGTLRVDAMAFPQPEPLQRDAQNVPTRTSTPANPPQQKNETDPLPDEYAPAPPPAWGSQDRAFAASFPNRPNPHGDGDTRDASTFGAVMRSFQLAAISPSARRFALVSIGVATAVLCVTFGVWIAHHRASSSELAAAAAVAPSSASIAAPTISVLAPSDSAPVAPVPATATAITAAAPIEAPVDHPHVASPARSHASASSPPATIPAAATSAAAKPRKLPGSGL